MTNLATYLAVELDYAGRHPHAWRQPDARPRELFTPGYWVELARLAERAGLDFLAIGDSFVPPEPGQEDRVRGRLDAVAIAARVAPLTSSIGLVPTATVTHTEPFHLSKAIATLDFVSLGRAGWQPDVSRSQAEADLFGRKDAAPPAVLWREAAEAIEVVARLWDSWEDDAVIRDEATGRYLDRDKVHYLDFVGEFFSVKGPSITPRSPQAHPLIVLDAESPDALLGRWADVVRVTAPDLNAAAASRKRVREAVAAAGRDPDAVAVLLDVELADRELADWPAQTARADATSAADLVEEASGAVDGVTLVPLVLPSGLRAIVDLVPELVRRKLRPARPRPGTLRDRFGLPRPANYFTGV